MDKEQVISTRDAAKLLGVSVRTVQLWVENGSLNAWKTAGNHRRIYLDSVNSLISQRQTLEPLILIVEDDQTQQIYYQSLFEALVPNTKLIFANNGFEGLLLLGKSKPSLLISDIDMPHMEGTEMVRSIRATEVYSDLPIVFVTGLSDQEIINLGPLPMDTKCYPKPLDIDSLREILSLINITMIKDG